MIFSGYEVDLIREAFSLYGWRDGEEYKFVCSSSILNETDHSAVIGRMPYSTYKYSNGYTYSYPTHTGRLGILVYSNTNISVSAILNTFSISLWLIIPGIAVFILFCLSVFEHIPHRKVTFWLKNMKLLNWISFSTIFFGEQNHKYRFPSKILVLGYLSFLSLLFYLFLASCISETLKNVRMINFPEKLENMRYTTNEEYLEYTAIYGGIYMDSGITSSNIDEKISLLATGEMDAIVMEYETLSNIAGENCDYILSSKSFISIFYAVELVPGADEALKAALDLGLSSLVRSYDIEGLKQGYFYSESSCSSNVHSVSPVSMFQIAEALAGYAGVFLFVFILRGMCNKRELIKERNKYIDEIRELITRPESKILKTTQNQVRTLEIQYKGMLQELEKNLKKDNHFQEKVLNSIRAKEVLFR